MWVAGITILGLLATCSEARSRTRRATDAPRGKSFSVDLVRTDYTQLPAVFLTAGNATVYTEISNQGTFNWVAGADCSNCRQAGLDITSLRATNNATCSQPIPEQTGLNFDATLCPVNATVSFGNDSYVIPDFHVLTDYPIATNTNLTQRFNVSGAIGFANDWDWDVILEPCLQQILYDQGYIPEASVGIYLAPDNSSLGELTFGDPETSKWCDNTTSVVLPHRSQGLKDPLIINNTLPSGYRPIDNVYGVHFDGFKARGQNITGPAFATIAINTLVWQLPEDIAFPLTEALWGDQAKYNNETARWTIPCTATSSANISLSLGGMDWPIPATDFLALDGPAPDGSCRSSILNLPAFASQYPTFLPVQFMKNVYSVFEADTQAIRLYKIKQQA